ncbi:MAG: hypothetical protein WBP79_15520 [Candidatus Acidiferrales bacterium]
MSAAPVVLSHFSSLLIFAGLVSAALACLTQRTTIERMKYAVWSFVRFVVIGVAIAWLIYPFSR